MYATPGDVVKRLGRALTDGESARVPGLLEEAVALVDGYCGQVFAAPVPVGVVVATSKIVARALTSNREDGGAAVSSEQFTAGSFTHQRSYVGDGSNVWLGAAEKSMLRPHRRSGVSVQMVSDRGL